MDNWRLCPRRDILRYALLAVSLLAIIAFACDGDEEYGQPPQTLTREQPPPKATPEPAAETLAFIRDGDIWLIDADGENERSLGLSGVLSFSWISSEEIDVVARDDRPKHLLVNVDGEVEELLFPGDFDVSNVHARGSWSADGQLFVVPVGAELVFYDRSGDDVLRLDAEPPRVEDDSRTFCDQPLTVKTENFGHVFGSPVFSHDGGSVIVGAFCGPTDGGDIVTDFPQNTYARLYKVPIDGGAVVALSVQTNLRVGAPPGLSPDGSQIAQLSGGYGNICDFQRGLSVADADGANNRIITPAAVAELLQQDPYESAIGGPTGFDWSPASNALVVSYHMVLFGEGCSSARSFGGLYIVPLDESPGEQLAGGPTRASAWSPSGRSIAYVTGEAFGEETEPPVIHVFDLSTDEVIDIGLGGQPAWQPRP